MDYYNSLRVQRPVRKDLIGKTDERDLTQEYVKKA